MSAEPRHYFTLEEYFALEHTGDARYEYWDGDIICMSGGSRWHSRISGSVFFSIRNQLSGRKCETFTADQPVKSPTLYPYRYPDVSVVCGKAEFETMRGIDALLNPILIVEVMSPTSEKRDREEKLKLYQAIPSLKEYLVVAQDKPLVIQHLRQENGTWVTRTASNLSGSITLESIGCTLKLDDIYQNIEFGGENT